MPQNTTTDLAIIGAGPGGYVAAIRAAQLGMQVTLIEGRDKPGGTCLNIGCIPSKALLHASHHYANIAKGGFKTMGIASSAKLDIKALMAHKTKIIASLADGIQYLLKKNRIQYIHGTATLTSATDIAIKTNTGKTQTIKASRILIATGSVSTPLKNVAVDETHIVTSTGALNLSQVPKRMLVIGGGYIGLEMACVWQRLGAEVEVVEFQPRILPGMDNEVASQFKKILEQQGIKFRLGASVTSAKRDKNQVVVDIAPANANDNAKTSQEKPAQQKVDVVLLAIGRLPYTDGLGLDDIGVARDERGRVKVDNKFATSVPNIYAIGDVIAGPMLAHKAEEDGVAAVEGMAGKPIHIDYNLVPGIVYTHPEVAVIGKTEEELKASNTAYSKSVFPFSANSRARAMAETDGLVKILAHSKTDQVLGVHCIGADAGGLIHECAMAMAFSASAEDIARVCHAHPTLNEAVREAALGIDKRAIHI